MNNLGNWLLQERRKRRWSQAELARRAGVSRPTISNYESGKTQNPNPDVIQAIARILEIPTEDAFRAAGLLPLKPEHTPANAQLDYIFSQLSPDDQAVVLDIVQVFLNHRFTPKRSK